MSKMRLAIYMEEREFQNRFVNCIMNHYQNQFELHVFTEFEELMGQDLYSYQAILLAVDASLVEEFAEDILDRCLFFYETEDEVQKEGLTTVYKYQEVNRIMEIVMTRIKEDSFGRAVGRTGDKKTRFIGLYGLSRVEYQMPLALTLAAILSEREKVLLVDLEANSGLSELAKRDVSQGLEELLVMAESGKYTRNRLMSCVGKLDHVDYIYPSGNSERISETVGATFTKMLSLLSNELDYDVIVINMGIRFVGFFELMNRCRQVFLLSRTEPLAKCREEEFFREMMQKGYDLLTRRIKLLELPELNLPFDGYERIVDQWKWNEFGEYIRKLVVREDVFAKGNREYQAEGPPGNRFNQGV